MITVLSQNPFSHANPEFSSPIRTNSLRRLSSPERKALLDKKMQGFQSTMQSTLQASGKMIGEQTTIRHTIVSIEKDQQASREIVKVEQKRQGKIDKTAAIIESDQAIIALCLASINQLWNKITLMPAFLLKDQNIIVGQLKGVDQKIQGVQLKAVNIQYKGAIIKQNLSAAALKVDHIQQQAAQIQAVQQAIGTQAEEIDMTAQAIQQKVQELIYLQEKGLTSDSILHESTKQTDFWSNLLQTIIDYASKFFAMAAVVMVGGGVDVKQWLALNQIYSTSDAINHPASWIAIGAVASAVIRNRLFSIACLSVECTMFYYRWSKETPKIS